MDEFHSGGKLVHPLRFYLPKLRTEYKKGGPEHFTARIEQIVHTFPDEGDRVIDRVSDHLLYIEDFALNIYRSDGNCVQFSHHYKCPLPVGTGKGPFCFYLSDFITGSPVYKWVRLASELLFHHFFRNAMTQWSRPRLLPAPPNIRNAAKINQTWSQLNMPEKVKTKHITMEAAAASHVKH